MSSLKKLFPNASTSLLKRNPDFGGLRPSVAQQPQGSALGEGQTGEATGGQRAPGRTGPRRQCRIHFTIYAVQPCDWDNYFLKPLQDLLIVAGFLDGDEWDVLSGSVESAKTLTKEEERTVIQIEEVTCTNPYQCTTRQPSPIMT